MSTAETAALIESVNDLTNTVAGKVQEIDTKVDEATSSVPNVIRTLGKQTFYIDAAEGDDSNDGTRHSPLASALEASNRAVPTAEVILYFRGEQDHIVEFNASCFLQVSSYLHAVGDLTTYARLHAVGKLASGSTTQKMYRAFSDTRDIFFSSVVIYCDDYHFSEDDTLTVHDSYSAFVFGNGAKKLFFHSSKILLNSHSLTSNWAGYSQRDISMNGTEISRPEGVSWKVLRDRNGSISTLRLACHSVTLPVDVSWSDLIPVNSDASNILTNLTIEVA